MSLLQRTNRIAVPSKATGNGGSGITDISWGNAIIVSDQGSAAGEREKLKAHFSKLEDAMAIAQSTDTILLFGDIQIDTAITVNDGRGITVLVMGGTLSSNAALVGPVFTVSNNSALAVHGLGAAKINCPNTGVIVSAASSGFFSLKSFVSVDALASASVSGGKAEFKDIRQMAFTGSGGGTCSFFIQNGGELLVKDVLGMSSTAAHLFCGNNASSIRIENVLDMSCATGDFFISNAGTGNELEIIGSKVSQAQSSTLRGIIEFLNEGKLKIVGSEVIAATGKVVNMVGELNISGSTLQTSSFIEVIRYTQSNAVRNEIVLSKLIGNPFFGNGMVFMANVSSSKLVIDGLRSNMQLPSDSNIIEGFITLNSQIF